MICPRCQQEVPEAEECAACGVVIAKFLARQKEQAQVPSAPPNSVAEPAKAGTEKTPTPRAPGPRQRQLLYRQLARMLDAGIPVEEALELLARHSSEGRAQRLRKALDRLRAGDELHVALRVAGGLFDESGLALLEAGEATGAVPASLEALAASAEVEQELRRQFLRALIYPFVIFTLVFFIPKAYMVVTSGWAAYLQACLEPYLLALLCVGFFVWGLPKLLAISLGPARYRAVLGRIPGLGGVMRQSAEVRFCRHLASALDAGLDLRSGLRLSAKASQDPAWTRAARLVEERLAAGESLHRALAASGLMDEDMSLILATGERSGRLAESLAQHAEMRQKALLHSMQVRVQALAILVLLGTYLFVVMSIKSEYEVLFGGMQDKLDSLMDGNFEGLLKGSGGGDMEKLMKELGGSIPPELRDVLK